MALALRQLKPPSIKRDHKVFLLLLFDNLSILSNIWGLGGHGQQNLENLPEKNEIGGSVTLLWPDPF